MRFAAAFWKRWPSLRCPNRGPPAQSQASGSGTRLATRLKVGDLEVTFAIRWAGLFDPQLLNGTKATMDGVLEALRRRSAPAGRC